MRKVILLLLIVISISIYSEEIIDKKNVVNPWTGEKQENGFEFKNENLEEIIYYYYGYEKEWFTDNGFEKEAQQWMDDIEKRYLIQYGTSKEGATSIISTKVLLPILSFNSQILNPSMISKTFSSINLMKMDSKLDKDMLDFKNENQNVNSIKKNSDSNKNYISSAIEIDFFEYKDIEGIDYNINNSYVRSINDKWESGAQLILNKRIVDDLNSFNMNFDMFCNRVIKETDSSEISIGSKINYTMIDDKLKTDDAIGLGLYLKGIKEFKKSILSYGTLYQEIFTNDKIDGYIVLGAMYSTPLLKSLIFKIDTITVSNVYNSEEEKTDEKFYLDTGVNFSYIPTNSFALSLGVKRKLFIEDYKSISVNLGTELAF